MRQMSHRRVRRCPGFLCCPKGPGMTHSYGTGGFRDCRARLLTFSLLTMRLHSHEFIRRFLLHVLPRGFHRIRHYGLFASTNRAQSIAMARALLDVVPPAADPQQQPDVAPHATRVLPYPCPCCGARMTVIEVFARPRGSVKIPRVWSPETPPPDDHRQRY